MTAQTWAALAMIVAAAVYLAICAWRTLHGHNAGPGCCGSGCPSARDNKSASQPQDGGNFVPLDNLADAARRHKQETGQ